MAGEAKPAPSTKALSTKLGYKAGMAALLLDLPAGMKDPVAGEGFITASTAVPEELPGTLGLVLAFTRDRAALETAAQLLLPRCTDATRVWLAYPKKSGAIVTDLTRDHGWEPMFAAGWIVVSIAAIDATWSAVRFRPRRLVNSSRC